MLVAHRVQMHFPRSARRAAAGLLSLVAAVASDLCHGGGMHAAYAHHSDWAGCKPLQPCYGRFGPPTVTPLVAGLDMRALGQQRVL